MSDNDTTRRRFLQVAGGTAAVGLAGCSSSSDDQSAGSDDESMDDESTDDESMDDESMDDESMDDESMDDESMDDGMGEPATVTVRVENVAPTDFYSADAATGGQVWITPGAYGVHTGPNPIFTEGAEASPGLEAIAEAGRPGGTEENGSLVGSLGGTSEVVSVGAWTPENTVADPNDPMEEVPGAPPIAPGGAFEFEVTAGPDQHLSFATMFVPSNDLFFAPGANGVPLFADGSPVEGDVTDQIGLWDAGTEPNQQPGFGDVGAPLQQQNGDPDAGPDEGGVVRPIEAVEDGYEYPAVDSAIQVTVTPQ
jgi:hypothetical protein